MVELFEKLKNIKEKDRFKVELKQRRNEMKEIEKREEGREKGNLNEEIDRKIEKRIIEGEF